jgi:hypothetical protein
MIHIFFFITIQYTVITGRVNLFANYSQIKNGPFRELTSPNGPAADLYQPLLSFVLSFGDCLKLRAICFILAAILPVAREPPISKYEKNHGGEQRYASENQKNGSHITSSCLKYHSIATVLSSNPLGN